MRCAQKSRDCYGEVGICSFDLDLPNIALCEGHVWAMFRGAPAHVRMQVAEELGHTDGE